MSEADHKTVGGFEVIRLSNPAVAVEVIPELGAKISSLKNQRTGREWMWSPPGGVKLHRNKTGDLFPESTLLGADECIPTIAACSWRGRELADHGEAWAEAWQVEAGKRIITRLRLPVSPFAIERAISLDGSSLRLDYKLTNVGSSPEEYVWALHPMMAVQPGDRMVLPAEVRTVRTDSAINFGKPSRGDRWDWPSEHCFDQLDTTARGDAVKLFTEPLRERWAEIRNARTGDSIRYEWEPRELNTLGVWINRGGWDGYHHVAIEPTNGAPDPLDIAVNHWKRHGLLAPGETGRWWVRITVEGG